jgi:hypothetical protein
MLPFIPILPSAQIPTVPVSPVSLPTQVENLLSQPERLPPGSLPNQGVTKPQEIRSLPGKLDDIPVFNSNSPEVVLSEGILLSTFPSTGMRVPSAHLNFLFSGRFDFFSHHISRASNHRQTRSLVQGVIAHNPSDRPVQIEILQSATYLTRPDALFIDLPTQVEDPLGTVFAGPGSRVVNDILRGRKQGNFPTLITLLPGQSQMLMNLPIPAGIVPPTSNGRSTLMRLASSGPVYLANLAMFAPLDANQRERIPTLEEWQVLLMNSGLVTPRDLPPTPPNLKTSVNITYGRVAGVAQGSRWESKLTDGSTSYLSVPVPGRALSYGLSTLERGTLGTGQIQSAPMLVRYPDTAYVANGNYGIEYNLKLPLKNTTKTAQTLVVSIQTPLKHDKNKNELQFLPSPESRIFFRGTVRVSFVDDFNTLQTRYVHLVQRRGQQGEPLITLSLKPGEQRQVEIDFLYPPDATPPQVLTISTLEVVESSK